MEEREQQIEQLHQQAAAHYLQGEFQDALVAWKRLLTLDPEDERAREGLRLCELLAEDSNLLAEPEAPSPPPVPAVSPTLEPEPSVEEMNELEDLLVSVGEADRQEVPAAPPAPGQAEQPLAGLNWDLSGLDDPAAAEQAASETALPDPDRQADGIDLGQIDQALTLGLADKGTVAAGGTAQAPVAAPAIVTEEPGNSEDELRLRVQSLMEEAGVAYGAGDRDGALSILGRLLILDETNAAALEMREAIQRELVAEAAIPPPSGDDATSAEADAEPMPAAPLDQAQAPLGPATAESQAEAVADPDLMAVPLAPANAQPASVPAGTGDKAKAAPVRRRAVAKGKASRGNLIILLVALVMVVGVGGYWMWMIFAPKPGEAGAVGATRQAGMDLPAAEADTPDEAAATPAGIVPQARPAASPEELMGQGRSALEQGRYEEAIVAFNLVLEAVPEHAEAASGLQLAGERYREVEELRERLDESVVAFEEGDYRTALKIFYRLPDDLEPERFLRYKVNGWYNLGVLSLRGGDCKLARSHLRDAAGLDPSDGDVAHALDLVRVCQSTRRQPSYLAAIEGLEIRALDD